MRQAAAWVFAIALPLVAQTPTVEGTTPRSTTERPNVSAKGMDQTLTGVLMDASCKPIASTRSDLTQMPPSQAATPAAMRQDGQTGAGAESTQGETARTKTEQEQRSLKVYSPQSTAGSTPASGRSSATAGPSQASATGTTGASVATAPTESNITNAGERTTERARSVPSSSASDAGTVREKYSECMVKPSSTSFAMHAGGLLYVMDRASNAMIQEQMRNEAFQASLSNPKDGSQWMTVTVQGTPTNDNTLTIRSVRK